MSVRTALLFSAGVAVVASMLASSRAFSADDNGSPDRAVPPIALLDSAVEPAVDVHAPNATAVVRSHLKLAEAQAEAWHHLQEAIEHERSRAIEVERQARAELVAENDDRLRPEMRRRVGNLRANVARLYQDSRDADGVSREWRRRSDALIAMLDALDRDHRPMPATEPDAAARSP